MAVGMVQGTRHTRRLIEMDQKLSRNIIDLKKAVRENLKLEDLKGDIFTLSTQLQTAKDENSQLRTLSIKLETAYKTLSNQAVAESQSLKNGVARSQSEQVKLNAEILDLKNHLQELLSECDASITLKARELSTDLASTELDKIHQTWDRRIDSLVRLFQDLTKLFEISSERQELLKNGFLVQEDNFNSQTESVRQQLEGILEETTTREGQLQTEIATLQAYQDGMFIEPIYLDKKFNSLFLAANGVIRVLHDDLGVTVKALGAVATDNGDCKVGIQLSAQLDPVETVKGLNERRKQIQEMTKLPVLDHFTYSEITNTVTFTLRNSPRTASIDRSKLYRSSDDFLKAVLGGRLFVRLVGTPGSGKTPTVAVLLSKILQRGFQAGNMPTGAKLPHLKIEMCNPLQGISVKNDDDVLDTFTVWDSATDALKGLNTEYQRRKDLSEKVYRESSGYLWICDEFDNAVSGMTPNDLQGFGKLLKDGGHLNMGAIVMGQSVMVSKSKSLSIEDQKMFTNVLLDGVSIRTFLESYGDKFYSEDVIERTKTLYEEIERLVESDNSMIVDSARQLRIGLVLADKSPVFYELPYFDGVEIDLEKYRYSLKSLEEKCAKTGGFRAKTGGTDSAQVGTDNAVTLAVIESVDSAQVRAAQPYTATVQNGTKPTCKIHPVSELTMDSSNRYRCPECKKRLTKKEILWN